ncbi:hypothetical protein P4B35_04650 [Pontiellaceae bacterium B12227]|nr:hypothetical protein [Pontiellaceae bacterium B12227]
MTSTLLETIGLSVDAALATLIWLVQLIIYPAFGQIRTDRFCDWHHGYMNAISIVVMPLMLAQAALTMYGLISAFSWFGASAAGCMLVAWGVTFTLSVPCHRALQKSGNTPELVKRIVATNWFRTIAWSAVLLLHLAEILWDSIV